PTGCTGRPAARARMSSGDPHRPVVLMSDRQGRDVDEAALTALALEVLHGEGVRRGELSVALVDADEMADLHVRYMGEEGPTDVLSFAQDEDDLLGDVVICPDVAAANNPDAEKELRLLLVHGILHLLGHDHEDEAERAEMWARQERYTGVRVP